MIDVIRAGVLTSVQDLGRRGYRHLGVSSGGALDALSLEIGNRIVGNRADAAGIEVTFGPTVLRFKHATRVAITGTDFGATLDDKPVYSWWSLPVRAGQELTLRAAKRGMRCYVAIAGGIDVLPMLGSRSTDLAACFGGLGGRALRDGDRLPLGVPQPHKGIAFSPEEPAFGVKAPAWCKFVLVDEPVRRGRHSPGLAWAVPIRVLRGPEYDSFSDAAQESVWNEEWTITPNSNRMGFRLSGTALERREKIELLSHAVLPGTIQVPPNGQPIILMGDAQTTGGYPKIGAVIRADLWKLAQVKLNGGVRFIETSVEEARHALADERQYVSQVETAIAMHEERIARAGS
ncbi:biotin-dependent carboxyltransferase family protein [Caballeronia sp. LZ029]|uniref:5-oxoprolinase subunit C family protein n=1 Tax=Caballeronia sp. LZ029 TaxID=3038564 RepID=UPI00285B8F18|nr:biotin-dependent carboxyltransferase family protein [Caballeronia sp. LZ029]MDR5744230.1 biotin-dependent carboxyltransferase family protein [Caballeronia sp. LZ029]